MKKDRKYNKQEGATAVELAIILPVLLLFIFGIIEFGLLLYNKNIINHAAREGARTGIVYSIPRIDYDDIRLSTDRYIDNRLVSFSNNIPMVYSYRDVPAQVEDEDGNINYIYSEFDVSNDEAQCPNASGTRTKLKIEVSYQYGFLFIPIANIGLDSNAIMICE